jgi:hypothetical protein
MQNKKPTPLTTVLPAIEDIIFIAILSMSFLFGPRMLSIDSDLGRHLTIGNYILQTRTIPINNILSYTKENESRPPYEWAAQTAFAATYNLLGLDGVILLCSLIIATTFAYLYTISAGLTKLPVISMSIIFLAAIASSIHWLPRPHIFTFLFLTIWTSLLETARKTQVGSIYVLPFIMLLWANFHGGFVFGFLVWFAYFAGEILEWIISRGKAPQQIVKLSKIGLLSLGVSVITPDGWGNWLALLGNNSKYIIRNTIETMPPDFSQAGTWPFIILLILVIVLPITAHTRPHASKIFLVAGMTISALYMARNIPLFAIISIPFISEYAKSFSERAATWSKFEARIYLLQESIHSKLWPIVVTIGFIFFIGIRSSQFPESTYSFNASVFPVQAANWLKEHPQSGNMFNEFNWGGYLEFRLWPQQLVFVDSQSDFYGESIIREYQKVVSADQGWENVIKKYDISWVIAEKNSLISAKLALLDTWILIYQDTTTVIFRSTE